MRKLSFIFSILLNFCFQSGIYSQKIINIRTKEKINITSTGANFTLELQMSDINIDDKYIAISTTPKDYLKPAFIYVTLDEGKSPSPDYRNFSSQEIGRNILYLKSYFFYQNPKNIYIFIKSLEETEIELEIFKGSVINLAEFPMGFKHKLNLSLTSSSEEFDNTHFEFKQKLKKTQKILFYALGENYNYFNFTVEYRAKGRSPVPYDAIQMFENGYGAIVKVFPTWFDEEGSFIYIKPNTSLFEYQRKKVEVGYEIIENIEDEPREIDILEHVYGMAEINENCYKLKENSLKNKSATMLINTFTQGVSFEIKNSTNDNVYSLDVFNNYFIKLPKEFYDKNNYFCFKNVTPHEEDKRFYYKISYDFQIYYDNELANYQMFIMPLISGKIYTHSLNRGDIMIYRNNFYGDYTEGKQKKIYSANMLRIRGNPKLYGFICEEYPNKCSITANDLKDNNKIEKINPLNMYYINKRLNAEGNTEIDEKGEALSEFRKQYMTIVSCESEENDPNKGECKYNIEINNERDEIQLIPETVFATSIISDINYFLIRLKDFENTKYIKLYFTVLIGNAELYLYEDWECTKELKEYNFSYIHRKEIIEIEKNLKENYYLKVSCSEPSFIQLKYETDAHDKGYKNLMPNEINIEPINNDSKSYYNMINPNYYYPLDNEKRNNDVYYKIETLDCSMNIGNTEGTFTNLTQLEILKEKNRLYEYLSSYGFVGQINESFHTTSKEEKCGIIVYGLEKSENRPLLLTSDMTHKSTLENTYYIFPFIYDKDNDSGILMEFKVYDTEGITQNDLYELTFSMEGKTEKEIKKTISDDAIYLDKEFYGDIFENNIMGNINIKLIKKYPEKKYYITTNIMSSKMSPEYLNPNQKYSFKLRPSSSKYFYSPLSKDSKGFIKFSNLPNNVKVYAKIVEKNKVEQGYNWNKRVKLPEAGDGNLLPIKDGLINYNNSITGICNSGCEIYFHIKSETSLNTTKLHDTNLIDITFQIGEGKEEPEEEDVKPTDVKPTDDKKTDDQGGDKEEEKGGSKTWIIIVVIIIVLGSIILLIIIMRKKRTTSDDIINKDLNELKMPLE